MIIRDTSSGHWYTRSGEPAYTVQTKTGTRSTTLRDARKLNLVPSVTTVLNVASKPALELWKQKQLLLAALTLPKIDSETEEVYIERILTDAKEEGRAAADTGTEIHNAIESFYLGIPSTAYSEHVKATVDHILAVFGTQPWIPERSFAHELGFGGKCDLHSNVDDGIILDVKTKTGDLKDVGAYDDHIMQLAAYRVGLGLPRAQCANVFVSRTHPGLVRIIDHSEEDTSRGWEMFTHLLKYWQLSKGYQ